MTKITLQTKTMITETIEKYDINDQTIKFMPTINSICTILNTEHTFKFDFLPKDLQIQPLKWKYRFINRKNMLNVYIYDIYGKACYGNYSLFSSTFNACLDAHMTGESFDEIMNTTSIKVAAHKIEDFNFIENDILDFTATYWFETLNQQVIDLIQTKVNKYSKHFFNIQRIALQKAYDHQQKFNDLFAEFTKYVRVMLDGWQLAYDSKQINVNFDLPDFNISNIKMLAFIINKISKLYHQIDPQIEIMTQDTIEDQIVIKLNQHADYLLHQIKYNHLDTYSVYPIYPDQILNQSIDTLREH